MCSHACLTLSRSAIAKGCLVPQARAQEARANWEAALGSKDRALQQLEAMHAVQRRSTAHPDPTQAPVQAPPGAPRQPAPSPQQLRADAAGRQVSSGGAGARQAAHAQSLGDERPEREISALRAALEDARAEAARERAAAAAALADCQAKAAAHTELERKVASFRATHEDAHAAAARESAMAAAGADQRAIALHDARHEQELHALRAALEQARSEAAKHSAAACAERAQQAEAASLADKKRRLEAANQARAASTAQDSPR